MLIGPIIKRAQIPERLFARCIHPEDIRSIDPIPIMLRILVIPPTGEPIMHEIEGHIGSYAWFEGLDFHFQPKTNDATNMPRGRTIFWSSNNNNGQEIVFQPGEPDPHMDTLTPFAILPSHDTWRPTKVVLLSFPFGGREEKMARWKETLDLVEQFHQIQLTHQERLVKMALAGPTENIQTYLAAAGHFRHGNPYYYIHAARYLREQLGFKEGKEGDECC